VIFAASIAVRKASQPCKIQTMAGNGEVRIKRELEEDPLSLEISIPVAPKTIRKDDAGTSGPIIPAIRVKPAIQITSNQVVIAPKPNHVVAIAPKPAVKAPDFSMLNKPPPIPFYLPKSAALVPRNISIDNVNDPPEIALKRLEKEATTLKEEVAALKWLAKRKEQEWNNIIELLKKKEETWLKVKRQAELAATDKAFQKFSTVIPNAGMAMGPLSNAVTGTSTASSGGSFSSPVMPDPPPPIQIFRSTASNKTSVSSSAPVITLASAAGTGNQPRKVLRPVSQPLTPQAIQQLQSQGLLKSGGMTADGKRIIIMKKPVTGTTMTQKIQSVSSGNTPTTFVMAARTASTSTVTKVVMANSSSAMPISATGQKKNPTCQECKTKPSKFECAGCSKMWYCSKDCQEKNWPKHEKECGLTKSTVVKQEIIDEFTD